MIEATYPLSAKEIFAQLKALSSELLRCDFGVSYLDDALLGMAPGEVTLLGARSGGGKTELAVHVVLEQQNFEKNKAKSVCYFALDHEVGEIEKRILWKLVVKQAREIGIQTYLRYTDWVAGKYADLLAPLEKDARCYIENLLALSETRFFYRKGKMRAVDVARIIESPASQEYNLFVIDHFHALLGLDSIEKQTEAITQISHAAEVANRPVLLLGQFRKRSGNNKSPIPDMEEFSGSAQLLYVPQNIVVLAPKFSDNSDVYETYFHVVKSRTASDTKNFVGVHGFDMEKKIYSKKYLVMRNIPYSEPEASDRKPPRWAKNASFSEIKEHHAYKDA